LALLGKKKLINIVVPSQVIRIKQHTRKTMAQTYVITSETMDKLWKKLEKTSTLLECIGGLLDLDKLAMEIGLKKHHIKEVWVNEDGRPLGLPDHPTARFSEQMVRFWGPMTVKGSMIVVLKNSKPLMKMIKETQSVKLNTVDDITDF